jgi:ATP-dependent Lhr-like helicase
LAARVSGYRPVDLDALCTSGDVVWIGAGGLGAGDGKVRLYFRDQVALLAPRPDEEALATGSVQDTLRAHLAHRGACFWADLRATADDATEAEVLAALWDLVWAGEVTNDSLAPVRAYVAGTTTKRSGAVRASGARSRPRPGRLTRIGPPSAAGRWSLVAPLLEPAPNPTEAAHARAVQLLERHGVLAREAALAEGVEGGFAGVYGVLKMLEERGQARRGYFVAGLGAAQFALPGAVDRLRAAREPDEEAISVVLATTDPAQPYGAALAWPEPAGSARPSRATGSFTVLVDGEPAVWLDQRGHHLVTFPGAARDVWVEALVDLVKNGRLRSIELRKMDGAPAGESPWASVLRAAGFADGYRGLVLRS